MTSVLVTIEAIWGLLGDPSIVAAWGGFLFKVQALCTYMPSCGICSG